MVKRNGWENRWLQHVADEPSAHNVAAFRKTAKIVRQAMPGIRTLDAVETDEVGGVLDCICPKTRFVQERWNRLSELKDGGAEIWCYVCCFPGENWLNRLLDRPLLDTTEIFWGCAQYDLKGFLHWAYNSYHSNQLPFVRSCGNNDTTSYLPAGDTHVVYPGIAGPWSGCRFEASRQGMEDLQLINLLKRRNAARAALIVKSVFRDFDDATRDVRVYRKARRTLLETLVSSGVR